VIVWSTQCVLVRHGATIPNRRIVVIPALQVIYTACINCLSIEKS